MRRYVCGFCFSPSAAPREVLLIRKNRPDWQSGKLNGVGGKIEEGETPLHAMEREFFEEAGLKDVQWKRFTTLNGSDFCVYFYYAFHGRYDLCVSKTDERLEVVRVEMLHTYNVIPNLRWLVPMALDHDSQPLVIHERSLQP